MRFEETNVEVFMGGKFKLEKGEAQTVEGLRHWLQEVDQELATWEGKREIGEVWMHKNEISVVLRD